MNGSFMESLVRSAVLRLILLLPVIAVSVIVLFDDCTAEASQLNTKIQILLNDDDDDDPAQEVDISPTAFPTMKELKTILRLIFATYEANETDTRVVAATVTYSSKKVIKHSNGFSLVLVAPPRLPNGTSA